MFFENIIEVAAFPPAHAGDGVDQFAMFLTLDKLSEWKLIIDLPMILAGMFGTKPLAEVSGDGRHTVGSKSLLEIMDGGIAIFVFATTKMNGRKGFGEGIDNDPQPATAFRRADTGIEFIHLREGND